MANFQTEGTFTPDRLVIGRTRGRKVVIASGAGVLSRGTLLGKIAVGGKYVKSAAAAGDGSEVPDAILAEDVNATAADVEAVVFIEGEFDVDAVTFGAGHTPASVDRGLREINVFLSKTQG